MKMVESFLLSSAWLVSSPSPRSSSIFYRFSPSSPLDLSSSPNSMPVKFWYIIYKIVVFDTILNSKCQVIKIDLFEYQFLYEEEKYFKPKKQKYLANDRMFTNINLVIDSKNVMIDLKVFRKIGRLNCLKIRK